MLEVHLYGSLRSMVKGSKASEDTILMVEFVKGETFAEFIRRMGLTRDELGDCFIDGTLTRPQSELREGARVALFPFNMVLLCGGQHLKGHGYTRDDVDVDYY